MPDLTTGDYLRRVRDLEVSRKEAVRAKERAEKVFENAADEVDWWAKRISELDTMIRYTKREAGIVE